MHMYVCMPEHLWKPETDIKCLPIFLSILFFETGSFTVPGTDGFSFTDWSVRPRDLPVSVSRALGWQACAANPRCFNKRAEASERQSSH